MTGVSIGEVGCGGGVPSMVALTSRLLSAATLASSRTQRETTASFDHRTKTRVAASSFLSISCENSPPPLIWRSHQTVSPVSPMAWARRSAMARSPRA